MRMQMLTKVALVLALSAGAGRSKDVKEDVKSDPASEIPELKVPEETVPDVVEEPATPPRRIGELEWHTSYAAAYKKARDERKMLFLFFRNEHDPKQADLYEHEVLTQADLAEPLADVVRVVLPLDAACPARVPPYDEPTLLRHSSFKYMYDRQGIAMIDLTDSDSDVYGRVVSAHPFTKGKHYTVRSTKIVLGLPVGTITQRTLIYAVRLHPAAPISTTAGKCNGYLCQQARDGSKLMANYESVGHHDWGARYGNIAANTGKSAAEVAAMGGNLPLVDAAIFVVDQWYGSPSHWSIMDSPASIFGYDLVRAPSGNWYGTGIFAN